MLFELLIGLGVYTLYKRYKNSPEKREWKLGHQAWRYGNREAAYTHYTNAVQLHNHQIDLEIHKLHNKAHVAQMKNKTTKANRYLEKAALLNRNKLPLPILGVYYDINHVTYTYQPQPMPMPITTQQPPINANYNTNNGAPNVNPNYFASPPPPYQSGIEGLSNNNNSNYTTNSLMQAPVAEPVLYEHYSYPNLNPSPNTNPSNPSNRNQGSAYSGNPLQQPLLSNAH